MKYRCLQERLLANSVPEHCGHTINGEPSECWLWIARQNCRGYGVLNLRVNGKHVTKKAHHVAAKVFAGVELTPDKDTWEHHCKQTLCIHPNHGEPMANAKNAGGRRNGRRT